MSEKVPPIMVRKWQQLEQQQVMDDWESKQRRAGPSLDDYGPFVKGYYFFYGTLMDPSTLAKVLHLSEQPKMRPAQLVGYHTKLWDQYPALLDGPPGHQVCGMACEVQSPEHLDRLIAYEPDKYSLEACLIQFLDITDGGKESVIGHTFLWNGEPEELSEAEFSLGNGC